MAKKTCNYNSNIGSPHDHPPLISCPQSSHRVAMVTFRRTFSIMMKKSAQPGEGGGGGGGSRPPPFTPFTITYKVLVYAPAEIADTHPLFLLYPYMYFVVLPKHCTVK